MVFASAFHSSLSRRESTEDATMSCDTVYIGNVAECTRLIDTHNASTSLVREMSADLGTLPATARSIYIILNALTDAERASLPSLCKAIKTHLPAATVKMHTVEQLKQTAERLVWERRESAHEYRFEDDILPCSKSMDAPSGASTREWYTKLLHHAMGKTGVSKLICVLHGASGVGKSLAISRIATQLERDAASKGRRDVLLALSAAQMQPDTTQNTLVTMRTIGRRADNVVVIDDFDAGVPNEILEAFAQLKCRRIVVCNDLYAKECRVLRNPARYFALEVKRVHPPSLLAHLRKRFPTLDCKLDGDAQTLLEQIVQKSRGDVRAALTAARWCALDVEKGGGAPARPADTERSRVGEMPNLGVLRCSQAPLVADECARTFGEGDVDFPAEVLYGNHLLYNPHELDVAAAIAELQSFGDTYNRAQEDSLREGSDAYITDKRLHFELAFAQPCVLLSRVTKAPKYRGAASELRMRLAALDRECRKNATTARRIEMRRRIGADASVWEPSPAIEAMQYDKRLASELVCFGTDARCMDTPTNYAALTFGAALAGGTLLRTLTALVNRRRGGGAARSETLDAAGEANVVSLEAAIKQFAANGLAAEDFVYACERHLTLSGALPPAGAASTSARKQKSEDAVPRLPEGVGDLFNLVNNIVDGGVDGGDDENFSVDAGDTKQQRKSRKRKVIAATATTTTADAVNASTTFVVEPAPKKGKGTLLDQFVARNGTTPSPATAAKTKS